MKPGDLLDQIEQREVAEAIRAEAERRRHDPSDYMSVEEWAGWLDAADFVEGREPEGYKEPEG